MFYNLILRSKTSRNLGYYHSCKIASIWAKKSVICKASVPALHKNFLQCTLEIDFDSKSLFLGIIRLCDCHIEFTVLNIRIVIMNLVKCSLISLTHSILIIYN
jgi:hypothetical protein